MMNATRAAGCLGAFAVVAAALLAAPNEAEAVNLNTSAVLCNPWLNDQSNFFEYGINGVRVKSAGPGGTLTCAVPRSPLASPQGFYVDGVNSPGWCTSITLSAYNYDGTFQDSEYLQSCSTTYDLYAELNPITTWSYVSALVSLPPAGQGTFYGVIALQ
jgi:hypothetical protein